MNSTLNNTKPTPDSIPLNEALPWIQNWQNSPYFNAVGGFKAFYIPVAEIAEFANKYANQQVGVRAYIGLKDTGAASTELKLVFVATHTDPDGTHKDIIESEGGELVVYDLSTPCPTDCDPKSKLFNPSL